MLGCFCALFKTEAILIAVGLTCAVTVALTIFAFQTKIDFTTCGGKYNSRLLQGYRDSIIVLAHVENQFVNT